MFVPNILIISRYNFYIDGLANQLGIEINPLNTTLMIMYGVYEYSPYKWFTVANLMYNILSYLLYRVKCNLIERINQSSKQLHRQPMINRIHESINSIQKIHRNFESTLSMYPFLTISELFFIVSLNIFIIKKSEDISKLAKFIIVQLVIKIFDTISMVLFVSYLDSKLKSFVHEVCDRINIDHRVDSTMRIEIVRMIKDATSHAQTGWGMFNLDLPLILSFLGSHITFNILFLSE